MFKNMRIGKKLGIGWGVVLALALILAAPKESLAKGLTYEGSTTIGETAIAVNRCAKKTKFVSWGRNPFSLSVALGLNGILWDDKFPQAIIGDVVVKVGDKIGSNTVISILKDRVILNDGAKGSELNLSQ